MNPTISLKCECGLMITEMEVPQLGVHGYAVALCTCGIEYNLYAKLIKRVNAPKKDKSISEKREGYGR